MEHRLKILPKWFDLVLTGQKTYEVRKFDRKFKTGDALSLEEWTERGYTGREIGCVIGYVFDHKQANDGIAPGFCVFSVLYPFQKHWTPAETRLHWRTQNNGGDYCVYCKDHWPCEIGETRTDNI